MPPHEAVRQLTRNKVDYLPIERDRGARRHDAVCWSIRPGIGTIVPGERIERTRASRCSTISRCSSAAAISFPASRPKIQGVYPRGRDEAGAVRFYTYVMRE